MGSSVWPVSWERGVLLCLTQDNLHISYLQFFCTCLFYPFCLFLYVSKDSKIFIFCLYSNSAMFSFWNCSSFGHEELFPPFPWCPGIIFICAGFFLGKPFPYHLAQQGAHVKYFLTPLLESPISPKSLGSFNWRKVLKTRSEGCRNAPSMVQSLLCKSGSLNSDPQYSQWKAECSSSCL